MILKFVDEIIDQVDLIQSYLKKNFIKEEKIVYRWEKFIEKYEDGLIYEIYIFKFIII